MYYALDNFADPDVFVLQDADRFHAIRHSGEILLGDGTTMILVIFVVRRECGLFDQFIVNKFFRPDGTTNRTLMSKRGIAACDIERLLATASTRFSQALQSAKLPAIQWNELDLRQVEDKDDQIRRIKEWGRLTSVEVKTDRRR
jgi:hypothetical protein